jgi:hypothetical protein
MKVNTRGKSLYSPTSTRKKSMKRYTSKKVNDNNMGDYHIDKNALRQMSLNLKKLHDDIFTNKSVPSSLKPVVACPYLNPL